RVSEPFFSRPVFSFFTIRRPPRSPLFPYTTLFRSTKSTSRRRSTSAGRALTSARAAGRRGSTHRRDRARPWRPGARQRTGPAARSEEHTSELQSRFDLVCRLLLEKKKKTHDSYSRS